MRGFDPRIHQTKNILCEEMDCNQSRMFPTLVISYAPKSGTPDFGVKPGNDDRESLV
jgi:hypothetical protein